MQMRFDGHVGFPGGLVEAGEEVVHGLIREMEEEINLDSQINQVTAQIKWPIFLFFPLCLFFISCPFLCTL